MIMFIRCILYLFIVSIIVFLIGRFFPRNLIKHNKFPFKSFKWEKEGQIYNYLKIKKWKTKLPDASILLNRIIPKIYPKKRMKNKEVDKAIILLKESCIAEGTHKLVSILGFGCILIWKSIGGVTISIVFYLFNVPFVIIQRYNRPRFLKLVNKYNRVC